MNMETASVIQAILGALVVFMATSLGALFILPVKREDKKMNIILMALAAGVMSSVIFEMIDMINKNNEKTTLLAAFFIGVLLIAIADRLIPHLHSIMKKEKLDKTTKKTALIVGTVALHNFPEGLAVASAFAHSVSFGWLITLSIAIQDIPEGIMVSAPLFFYGLKRRVAIPLGFLSGFLEGLTAVIGYFFLSQFDFLVPFAIAFSAGAMSYLVLGELFPDMFAERKYRLETISSFFIGIALPFLIGFLLSLI